MGQYLVDENKLIATINEEFQKKFPHLVIFFFTPETWKAQQKSAKKGYISGCKKLADVKTKTSGSSQKIFFNGSTKIGVLENSFIEQYGLIAQIGCSKKENEFQYTNVKGDSRTLEELSTKIKNAGYIKNPKPDSYKLSEESSSSNKSNSKKKKVEYNYMHPLS